MYPKTRARTLPKVLRCSVALAAVLAAAACSAGIKGRADPPDQFAKATNRSVYADDIANAIALARVAEAAYCLGDRTACLPDDTALKATTSALVAADPATGSATATVPSDAGALLLYRNNYLNEMMRAYDLALQDYARSLAVEGGTLSFGQHLVNLGLSAATSIVSDKASKDVLAALGTAFLGIKNGYDEKVLIGKTIAALINEMRAAQARMRANIAQRMTLPVTEFPLSAARHEVAKLGAAATVETAVAALQASAKQSKQDAEADEANAQVYSYARTDFTDRLRKYFRPKDKALAKTRVAEGVAYLKKNNVKALLSVVIADGTHFKAVQAKMIEELKIP